MRRDLYFGDNLDILRDHSAMPDNCVDLIYLDPPFNSKKPYNMLFRDRTGRHPEAQIEAFDDSWVWSGASERALDQIMQSDAIRPKQLMQGMQEFLGNNDMMAYLTMMTVRLIEMHRVLKDNGSLYLHCDPTASHYLKMALDAVFGPENYRNEVVWRRSTSHSDAKRFGRIADRILYYAKGDNPVWNGDAIRTGMSPEEEKKSFTRNDERGPYRNDNLTGPAHGQTSGESATAWRGYDVLSKNRVWSPPKTGKYADFIAAHLIEGYDDIVGVHDRLDALDKAGLIIHPQKGFWPGLKRYADSMIGHTAQDIILKPRGFTNFTSGKERLGYPTQKPLALIEPLIKVSSNQGDVVFDPFCGCGTTIHAAERLGRQWIGIDVTHLAVDLVQKRLEDAFEHLQKPGAYNIFGIPKDLESARKLARERPLEFEKWAVSRINGARPYKTKGADQGVDGIAYFKRPSERRHGKIIVSVKGGENIGEAMIRDLLGTLESQKADLGLFLTLHPPTKPMRTQAAAAGICRIGANRSIPKIQIATIEDILDGKLPELPNIDIRATYKKVASERQKHLDL